MSSTNRNNAEKRHVSDYYVTPLQPIRDLFLAMNMQNETNQLFYPSGNKFWFKHGLSLFDPCAGGDADNEMSYPTVIREYFRDFANIKTNDIRKDSLADNKEDFLKMPINFHVPDIIITNPPFNIAEEVIKKSLKIVPDNGFVIMLLRLNFFGSEKRREFWKDNMPILTFVHANRINFMEGKINPETNKPYTGDSIEYAHMCWKQGVKQNYTKLIII